MKHIFITTLFLFYFIVAHAQLSINGGYIQIANNATLVVNGPIINRSGGGIISEGANNVLVWNVGNSTAMLTAPFATATAYLPTRFQLGTGASNDGSLVLSTYAGHDWKNSDYLPPSVTNINRNGADNSAKLVDRFWQVQLQHYGTAPGISQLSLYYNASELLAPNNITESALIGQRWNNRLGRWDDYFPNSSADASNHFITMSNIPANQVFGWWAAVDGNSPLPVSVFNFTALNEPTQVLARWQTATEVNSKDFEVQRSTNGNTFNAVGSVLASGNSNKILDYSFADLNPLNGISYYRLKANDISGQFKYSEIVAINRDKANEIRLFPNPAHENIYAQIPENILTQRPLLQLYDAAGKLLVSKYAQTNIETLSLQNLPAGMYWVKIFTANTIKSFSILKK